MPLRAVLNQIWETVQPSNPSSKPVIFDRIVEANEIDNNSTTSDERWSAEGHLFQHWPEEPAEMLHNEFPEVTVSSPNERGTSPPVPKVAAGRIEHEDSSVRDTAIEALVSQSPQPDDIPGAGPIPETIDNPEANPYAPLRLLSLDGGGVRGLSSLMVLDHLMESISLEEKRLGRRPRNDHTPLKPCDYFDL